MKQIRISLSLVALVLAIAASAFTTAGKAPATTMYWFPTDASGNILNQTIDANDHLVKPCEGALQYCAVGFTEQQVIDNGNGTVTLQSGLDKNDGVESRREN